MKKLVIHDEYQVDLIDLETGEISETFKSIPFFDQEDSNDESTTSDQGSKRTDG